MEFIDLKTVVSLTIPALITIFGWFIVNRIGARRDRNNKKREKVIEHLITSYKVLTDIPHRDHTNNRQAMDRLEDAITNIQLFGTKEQIRLAKEIVLEFTEKNVMDIGILTKNLRKELRKELGLEEIDEEILYFRIFHGHTVVSDSIKNKQ